MRILCVCTGNTCRSPLMAVLLDAALRRAGIPATVESAGTDAVPGDLASAGSRRAAQRRGLDLSGHRARALDGLDLASYDRVLAATPRHAVHLRSRGVEPGRLEVLCAADGGVPDPFGGNDDAYEMVARALESEAQRLVKALFGLG